MSRLRVVLVDDHGLVRAGLRALLSREQSVEVVGEGGDGHEGWRLIVELKPDIALLDIAMPGLTGLDLAMKVKEGVLDTKVIMLSMHSTDDVITQALRAGASGYLLKDSATEELMFAIGAVVRGEIYLSPAVSKRVVHSLLNHNEESRLVSDLTARQREILIFIAKGLSTKEIAHHLEVSIKTIEAHRAQIMERIQIRDVAGLVRYAIKNRLIDIDEV